MDSFEHENAELREQLRVLGSNFESMRRTLNSLPQPAEPADVGDGEYECGKCYAMLDTEWRYCPWCGSKIIWEVDA